MTKELGPGDEVEMISNPRENWPRYPYLPVKRRSNKEGTECGIIFAGENNPSKIIIRKVNLFMIPDAYAEYQQLEGYEYNSIDQLLQDGWVVD